MLPELSVMPRYARIHVTGGLFHVISRFHNRRYFLDVDGARVKYLELLGKALATHDSRIIAYCLMSSHIHLVLQLGNDLLGAFAKKVYSPFGVWINSRESGLERIRQAARKDKELPSRLPGQAKKVECCRSGYRSVTRCSRRSGLVFESGLL